ncbi:MAG: NAD-dependent epimerase/dehydratase family protein, partial [Gemmatimonas sp.]|nr:NAD-dependent epimerase/dehydratase family protein [Gemmatimonas sp.]
MPAARQTKSAATSALRHDDNVSSPPLALVTGATGMVGPALVYRLLDAGSHLRVLSRREPSPGILPENVEVHTGDIGSPLVAAAATRDTDAVFHLAGLLHQRSVTEYDPYLEVNVR